MKCIFSIFVVLTLCGGVFADEGSSKVFNVRDFGARGDGNSIDSPGINKAVEAASAAGGGIVHVPAGTYMCGSIRLKDNITLELEKGATIVAAPGSAQAVYDAPEPTPEA